MDQATTANEAGEGAPLQTLLNETTFDNYHLFRADAQILTAGNSTGGSIPSAPADASSNSTKSPSAALTTQANETGGSAPSAAPSDVTAVADGAGKSANAAPATTQLNAALRSAATCCSNYFAVTGLLRA